MQCLVGVSYSSNNDIKSLECNDAAVIRDVLNYSNLLKESKSTIYIQFTYIFYLSISNLYFLCILDCNDPLTLWWANLLSIDACWLLGDDVTADKMFEDIRKVPKLFRESKDPSARTAVTVFCAKKLLA